MQQAQQKLQAGRAANEQQAQTAQQQAAAAQQKANSLNDQVTENADDGWQRGPETPGQVSREPADCESWHSRYQARIQKG